MTAAKAVKEMMVVTILMPKKEVFWTQAECLWLRTSAKSTSEIVRLFKDNWKSKCHMYYAKWNLNQQAMSGAAEKGMISRIQSTAGMVVQQCSGVLCAWSAFFVVCQVFQWEELPLVIAYEQIIGRLLHSWDGCCGSRRPSSKPTTTSELR